MLTNLNNMIQSCLPFFKKGGRFGSWRLYIIAFAGLVATPQGQAMLSGIGLTPGAITWLSTHATRVTMIATFVTMIKDHAGMGTPPT